MQQQRVSNAPTAPRRNAGEDTVAGIVGKKKQGNNNFVLWESDDGMLLNDQCTWQQAGYGLVSTVLTGKAAAFKLGQTIHLGTIIKQHETEKSKYFVESKSRRQDRWVDLELPELVSNGEYSYWRLDGYETWDEREGESEEEKEEGDNSESDDDNSND